jgi:pimeloyl-ACP methyl ester carboxylesterase
MRPSSLTTVLLPLLLMGCLRLDVFVFRPFPEPDDDADLMARSVVPAELRTELKTEVVSSDGTVVNAWLLSHAPGDGTDVRRHGVGVLYAHGQNNDIRTSQRRLDLLWQLGYSVLAYDARGWGKTRGVATETTHTDDARAARAWLEGRFGADRVAFYGRSLGTLFLVKLSAERSPKVLVLESPVLSIQRIIDDSVQLDTPAHWYVDGLMDSRAELPQFTGSLLICHGEADDYVRVENGRELFAVSEGHAAPRRLWIVPGADHGNVPCEQLEKTPEGDGCAQGPSAGWVREVTGAIDAAVGVR